MEILLRLIISALSYLILPFIFFYKRTNKYDNKTIKIMLIFNSIIVKLLWILLEVALYSDYQNMNFAPAVFYYFINAIIWNKKVEEEKTEVIEKNSNKEKKEIVKSKEKKKTKQKNLNKSLLLPLIVSVIINICLIGVTLYFNNTIKKQERIIDDNISEWFTLRKEKNTLENSLNNILDGKSELYVQQKLKFFDNNIVFVVNGYNNYLSYDCLRKTFDGKKYSYWAYNREAAISKGYKEYKCN